MNVQFSGQAVDDATVFPAAAAAPERCLFVLTPSLEECGVESFARQLVNALRAAYLDDGYAVLPVSGRWRDLPAVFRKIARADRIVFSVPLVAWKRLLVLPLVILLFAKIAGREVDLFMHEWTGLHWLRRIVFAPFLLLSHKKLVGWPFIVNQ